MSWRFYLQAVPEGEWIDKDVPLSDALVTEAINGPASISGTIPFEYGTLRLPSGRLAVREWGCLLIAEDEGRDPIVGIVDRVQVEGETLRLEAGGLSMYPNDQPWRGPDFSSTSVDPLDVVRMIWDHLQSYPDGNLGVAVDQTTTPVRLGKPETPAYTAAKNALLNQLDMQAFAQGEVDAEVDQIAATKAATFAAVGITGGNLLILSKSKPSGDRRNSKNLWFKGDDTGISDVMRWNGSDWVNVSSGADLAMDRYWIYAQNVDDLKLTKDQLTADKKKTATLSSKKSELESDGKAVPYTLTWFETDDLGKTISDLAETTPFEFREVSKWDGEDLTHRLQIGYPKLGARRENLRFEIGVNVTATPSIDEGDYASELILRGAGEGRKKVGALVTQDLGRLRRVATVVDETLSTKAKAEESARPMLKKFRGSYGIESLTVIEHPAAPLSAFDPGDEIYAQGDAGWLDIDGWYRVLEKAMSVDSGSATLKVEEA